MNTAQKTLGIVLSAFLLAGAAQAQTAPVDGKTAPMHHGMGGHNGMHKPEQHEAWMKKLNLSEAQKAQIKALRERNRAQFAQKAMPQDKAEFHAKMQALLEAPTFDEARARELVLSRQNERVNREVQMLKARHDFLQILTPQQRQLLKEHKGKHHGMGGKHDHGQGKDGKGMAAPQPKIHALP